MILLCISKYNPHLYRKFNLCCLFFSCVWSIILYLTYLEDDKDTTPLSHLPSYCYLTVQNISIVSTLTWYLLNQILYFKRVLLMKVASLEEKWLLGGKSTTTCCVPLASLCFGASIKWSGLDCGGDSSMAPSLHINKAPKIYRCSLTGCLLKVHCRHIIWTLCFFSNLCHPNW